MGHEEALHLAGGGEVRLACFTGSEEAALRVGGRLETVFMNRCDYLDPALAWTGVGHSGRGVSLSRLAYEHLTRPKSFHLRLPAAG
jgi:acyl-CoA reductase-like NAD-dependent aldehyde dehydrogenase